jgi:hypothetical protein
MKRPCFLNKIFVVCLLKNIKCIVWIFWEGFIQEKTQSGKKNITIQKVDICETTWCKIVGLLILTYMLYKLKSKWGCWFIPHGNKGTHKLWNQMFNLWLTCVLIQCRIEWKELEMVNHVCGVLLLDTWNFFKQWSNQVISIELMGHFNVVSMNIFYKINAIVFV